MVSMQVTSIIHYEICKARISERFQWAGSSLIKNNPLNYSHLQSAERFTPGFVSSSLFCKHEPDYICGTIPVNRGESIQWR